MKELFRALPPVDVCLAFLDGRIDAPRALLKDLVNTFLESCRERIRNGRITDVRALSLEERLGREMLRFIRREARPKFRRVLNATGVVVHTNLGRSVLAPEAVAAVQRICSGYANLEFDLETGKRGSRYSLVEKLLCRLTGAEAALVVNNNAAAVFLALEALCRGREVVVARGQLVEIGGSFRIPDIMVRSGTVLREVGCTNRVHLKDYEEAIGPETAALMHVHTSNFRVVGFHSEVPAAELVRLAREHGLMVIEDLGSGSLVDLTPCGLPGEPTVVAAVGSGADVVTFSGDKVLGGPQAGILVGRAQAIAAIKADPLNRMLRVDKMTLAALEATLRLYIDPGKAETCVPTLRMTLARPEELERRARRLAALLKRTLGGNNDIRVAKTSSRVGGGAFPENDLPGWMVRVCPHGLSAEELRQRLLETDPPLVGKIDSDAFCLDLRTLADNEFKPAAAALAAALADTDGEENDN